MQQGTLVKPGSPPSGFPNRWTYRSERAKAAVATISIVTVFALMAVVSLADRVWAQACGGSLTPQIQKPAGTPNNGPFVVGDVVTIQNTITNNTGGPQTVTDFVQKLTCLNTTDFSLCTTADDTAATFVAGSVTTDCPKSGGGTITWNVNTGVANQVTFTPSTTLTLANGASCHLSFNETIAALGTSTTPLAPPPSHIDWASNYDASCGGLLGGAQGSGVFAVLKCSVEVDKQVSCDGGKTFFDVSGGDDTEPPSKTLSNSCIGFNAFGANPATNIEVRYRARNTGDVDATCLTANMQGLTDTNLLILPAAVGVASIPATQTTYTTIDDVTRACSSSLGGNEPDTASLACQCSSGGNTFIAPVSMDTATFLCQSPQLTVSKTCGAANAAGNSAVSVSYSSAASSAALSGCTLTDKVFAGACVGGAPSSATVVDVVANAVAVANNPTSSIQTINGLTAMGLNNNSCTGSNCCNQATMTCNLTGSPGPETFSASNVANCPVTVGGCFSRSPGFWAEHFKSQTLLYAQFGPIDSCGIDLTTANAITQGSGTEDLCSIGGGQKNPPQTSISNTQRQLERQCAAANMNLAVSSLRRVDCEVADPGITNLIDNCCNSPKNVCNDGALNGFTTNGCISALNVFNNTAFAGPANATDFGPPGAQPAQCKAAKASGFVNKRSRP